MMPLTATIIKYIKFVSKLFLSPSILEYSFSSTRLTYSVISALTEDLSISFVKNMNKIPVMKPIKNKVVIIVKIFLLIIFFILNYTTLFIFYEFYYIIYMGEFMKKKTKEKIARVFLWIFLIIIICGMSAGIISIFAQYFI